MQRSQIYKNEWVTVWDGHKHRLVQVPFGVVRRASGVTGKTGPASSLENIGKEERSNEENENHEQIDDVDRMLENLRGVCPTCDKRFSSDVLLEMHVAKAHRRPYRCHLCQKAHKTKYELKLHKRTHTEVYKCPTCGRKFQRRQGLKHHQIRSHSTTGREYICDYCGKVFKLKSDIAAHILMAHSTSRHICHVCGREVKYLMCHMRKHLNECDRRLKFYCHLCSREFASQTKLDNHLLLHQEVYQCQECGKQCRGPDEMSRHRRMHQNSVGKCPICRRTFSKTTLRPHILSHAGLRPYKCDICEADFTQRSSLMRHRKSHPGPLPRMASVSISQLVQNVLQNLAKSE